MTRVVHITTVNALSASLEFLGYYANAPETKPSQLEFSNRYFYFPAIMHIGVFIRWNEKS